ncbi:uncharacterized protein LOC115288686 [Suricata suricatta]|uniref:uncharacterized protein LOC115288686 n=1 Tax=Suricata suricatta TaxID=37032 RepID=UPI00115572D3|nr:uncharacterized protein LOC115288686 [Suricata suricatta]
MTHRKLPHRDALQSWVSSWLQLEPRELQVPGRVSQEPVGPGHRRGVWPPLGDFSGRRAAAFAKLLGFHPRRCGPSSLTFHITKLGRLRSRSSPRLCGRAGRPVPTVTVLFAEASPGAGSLAHPDLLSQDVAVDECPLTPEKRCDPSGETGGRSHDAARPRLNPNLDRQPLKRHFLEKSGKFVSGQASDAAAGHVCRSALEGLGEVTHCLRFALRLSRKLSQNSDNLTKERRARVGGSGADGGSKAGEFPSLEILLNSECVSRAGSATPSLLSVPASAVTATVSPPGSGRRRSLSPCSHPEHSGARNSSLGQESGRPATTWDRRAPTQTFCRARPPADPLLTSASPALRGFGEAPCGASV